MSNSNQGDFFVMLNTQKGGYTPLMRGNGTELGDIASFDTKEEAKSAANSTVLGSNFGYEVFEIGCGC